MQKLLGPLSPGVAELAEASFGEDEDAKSLDFEHEKKRRFGLALPPEKVRGLEERLSLEAWSDDGRGA